MESRRPTDRQELAARVQREAWDRPKVRAAVRTFAAKDGPAACVASRVVSASIDEPRSRAVVRQVQELRHTLDRGPLASLSPEAAQALRVFAQDLADHPHGTVGEPVLRDLFGALHHLGANRAALVTTGQLTKAARAWLVGKPIEVWDAARLKADRGAELAVLAEQVTQSVSPEGRVPTPANSRTAWYVYTDNHNNRWAVELPRSIGGQLALGFEPLTGPKTPPLPRTLRMRYIGLRSREPTPRYLKRIPFGRPDMSVSAWTEGLVFTSKAGRQTT